MEVLDGDFKTLHLQIVNLIDEEAEELEQEQDTLDKHDDDITALSLRLKQLVSKSKSPVVAQDNGKKAPAQKLACLECSLGITDDALSSTSSDPDVSLCEQHSEQLADYKKELASAMKSSCFWTWKKMMTSSSSTQSSRNFTLPVLVRSGNFLVLSP